MCFKFLMIVPQCSQWMALARTTSFRGMRDMEDGTELLPFVSSFYGRPSTCLWKTNLEWSTTSSTEGGEQGDALMPMLFSFGQHRALVAITRSCLRSITTFMPSAILTGWETYTSCCKGSCGTMHASRCIWARHKCGTEQAKALQLARRCNVQPCKSIPRPECGKVRPRSEQGLKILGTPVGQPEYVTTKLDQLVAKHRVLLERILAVNGLQSGCCC